VPGIEAKRIEAKRVAAIGSQSQDCRLGFPSWLSGVEKAK
jgi:hypothetical protein